MIGVLFICLGNICRSPMAEAVFRDKVRKAGLTAQIRTDSAGTGDWHAGEKPHHGTRGILDRYGVDYSGIRARQVKRDDFGDFQYLIAMDDSNVRNLLSFAPDRDSHATVRRLLDFAPDRKERNVPDPYYTGNFDEVYEMVEACCTQLLAFIREREGL
ncbi:low molecular weight phosphotyrosine protein phosphatase [Paenibacillus athensensis]|uniref:protein-tyrosine-phosphatase n=1 Tax=Paenibacillus athensensis TaxID=1967502 RepID=A0A4Y8QAX9_9BACL|nr:low molecular weight protein-tyrosine-phosphatase [Paenibacillus athensensis]MCD1257732.1 low molecular weight phosphotyrosine protein phosphatase [Paenibacillus athensensis]